MTQQVKISVPHPLYQRMQNLASTQNQPIDDLLEMAISLAETAFIPDAAQIAAMRREEAAYEAMHAELMAEHRGDYVAIYQGELVDYDQDETSLLRRLEEIYPDQVVLMKKVRPLPEATLHFRSPRLLSETQ